jgi:hypothetical protein
MIDVDDIPYDPAVYDLLDLPDPGRVAQHMTHGQDHTVLLARGHDLTTVRLSHLKVFSRMLQIRFIRKSWIQFQAVSQDTSSIYS